MKKKALVIVNLDSQFVELKKLAVFLKKSESFEPQILFAGHFRSLEKHLSFCQQEGLVYFVRTRQKNTYLQQFIKTQKKRRPKLTEPLNLIELLLFFFDCLHSLWHARGILQKSQPDILLMAEDNLEYGTPELIKLAHCQGKPSVIFPYTIANTEEAFWSLSKGAEYHLSWSFNCFVAKKFPHWLHESRDTKLLRYPWYKLLIVELLKLAPAKPWIFNSSQADCIVVESQFMEDYYHAAGILKEKLVNLGSLTLDEESNLLLDLEGQKLKLCERHNFDPLKPLVLCAIPPKLFKRPLEGFEDYETFLSAFFECLQKLPGCNVLLKFHPNTPPEEFEPQLTTFGLRFSEQDTSELLPLCDLFIASASATIRWALACRKKVINFDCYGFDYSDFKAATEMQTCRSLSELEKITNVLLNEDTENQVIEPLQRNYWGELDGQAGARILKFLNELTD